MALSTHAKLLEYLNIDEPTETKSLSAQTAVVSERMLERFGVDFRCITANPPSTWELTIEEDNRFYYYTDQYRIRRAMPKEGGFYYDIVEHPLAAASKSDLDHYECFDPLDPAVTQGMREKAHQLWEETDYAIVADVGGAGIFEMSWFLRGFENFLVDMAIDPEFANALLDRMLEIKLGLYQNYLDAVGDYIHVIATGDDLSTQTGPLISPEMYRKYLKPRQKELVDFIKSRTGARIFYHCCGNINPFMEDLLEVGVDIINPVQVSAADMNSAELKRRYGDRIIFWGGGCDTQKVLQFGTPDEVIRETSVRLRDFTPGGGFVFNQVHEIQANTPPENIVAMLETALNFVVKY